MPQNFEIKERKGMKRFVLGIVIICWITIVFAAGNGSKVTGILNGKTNKAPVEFATIALYEATTKKLVTGAMTDSTGCFHLEDVPTGRYYLVGSYVGYGETQSEMFIVGNGNQTVDVGVLWIDDKGQVLNEVVVAGRKSTFVPKLDRKVFNVGQDLMSSAGSASELIAEMEQSPYSYFNLAHSYEVAGDYEHAIEAIEKAIALTELNNQYKRYKDELVTKKTSSL